MHQQNLIELYKYTPQQIYQTTMKFQNKIQKNKLLEKTKLNSWHTKLQLKLNNHEIKILNHKNSVFESIWEPKKLKRHIYTQASIEKSIEKDNKIPQRFLTEASNRFEEDHHNTESIAQLFEHEQVHNQFRTTNMKFINQQGAKKQSVAGLEKDTCASNKPSESYKIQPSKRSSSDTYFQDTSFLEGYVQGKSFKKCQNFKAQKQQEYCKIFHTVSAQENTEDTLSYQRMEIKLLENQQKKMRQHRQNKQFLRLIDEYKLNKEHIIRQTNRKVQSKQMLAKCRVNSLKMFDKLPLINNCPQDSMQNAGSINPQKKIKCILVQNEGINKITKSNSDTKLNIKQLKNNLCLQNKTLLNDVDEVQILKEQLRKKKIVISSNNLVKGYVNFQKQPIKLNQIGFPKHNLPSKPLYKKFPI